jgi:ribosomal protein L11 methylase PrmA
MDVHGMSDVFGVVLANLTGALLERSASKLKALLEPGGCLIASGFMENETDVVSTLKKELSLQNLDREDGWMCGTFLNL